MAAGAVHGAPLATTMLRDRRGGRFAARASIRHRLFGRIVPRDRSRQKQESGQASGRPADVATFAGLASRCRRRQRRRRSKFNLHINSRMRLPIRSQKKTKSRLTHPFEEESIVFRFVHRLCVAFASPFCQPHWFRQMSKWKWFYLPIHTIFCSHRNSNSLTRSIEK